MISEYHWSGKKNAGDYLTKYILEHLYDEDIVSVSEDADIAMCGSILTLPAIENAKNIIGCGYINDQPLRNRDKKAYRCVRGKLTKERVVKELGLNDYESDCLLTSEPGLLISKLYKKKYNKPKYEYGIVCHYVDHKEIVSRYGKRKDVKIITMGTNDIESVVDSILQCKLILSSSLHGLVFAHAYGVPAYHIAMGKLVDSPSIEHFKFKDYYSNFSSVDYKSFLVRDYNIPFIEVKVFDSKNREKYVPSEKSVRELQNRVMKALPYKSKLKDCPDVIVSMTSWSKRIGECHKAVLSCLNQTHKPKAVYLNLSVAEFPDRKIPDTLLKLEKEYPNFIINWVIGPNTKSMKKIFPILSKLKDSDLILDMDDDIILPSDVIEKRLDDFYYYGCKTPITSHDYAFIKKPLGLRVVSAVSMMQKKMLNNWELYVNDDIIKTYNDDRTYAFVMWLNGYKCKPATTYPVFTHTNPKPIPMRVMDGGMSANNTHLKGKDYNKVAEPIMQKLTGRNFQDSYNYFRKQR